MAERTWKIGESARGGVITAKATKTKFTIIAKEWDFSAGSTRGSSQANAKEWSRKPFNNTQQDLEWGRRFLEDLTTPYYADKIMEWIQTKVEFQRW